MKIFSSPRLVAKKQRKIERVNLNKLSIEQDYLDQSIRIPENAKKQSENKIRLCYVALENFHELGSTEPKISTTFGSTCVFKLPEGLSLEDACKLVSYLSERIEEYNSYELASEMSVEIVGSILDNYGITKMTSTAPDYSHSFDVSDYNPAQSNIVATTKNVVKKNIDGVVDLMTIGGDPELFQRSDLNGKEFNWFMPGVDFEEIKQIYNNIGIEINRNGIVSRAKERE